MVRVGNLEMKMHTNPDGSEVLVPSTAVIGDNVAIGMYTHIGNFANIGLPMGRPSGGKL